jgi:hypothetical protein
MPKSAQAKQNAVSPKSSAGDKQTVRDTVVEYAVMQTKATTPEVLAEDEDYWMKTVEAQSART